MADEKKKTSDKTEAKKPAAKKPAAKKPAAKKPAAKKPAAKKPAAKKPAAKKPAAKKDAAAKKPAAKKDAAEAEKKKVPTESPVVRAKASYVRIAPRKARLVADQVRGMAVPEAIALLRFSPRSAAQDIAKLVNSAASNAEHNHDLIADDLRITEITVDEGPTLRRYRPRAMGRATRINKRTSHIKVALKAGGEQ